MPCAPENCQVKRGSGSQGGTARANLLPSTGSPVHQVVHAVVCYVADHHACKYCSRGSLHRRHERTSNELPWRPTQQAPITSRRRSIPAAGRLVACRRWRRQAGRRAAAGTRAARCRKGTCDDSCRQELEQRWSSGEAGKHSSSTAPDPRSSKVGAAEAPVHEDPPVHEEVGDDGVWAAGSGMEDPAVHRVLDELPQNDARSR